LIHPLRTDGERGINALVFLFAGSGMWNENIPFLLRWVNSWEIVFLPIMKRIIRFPERDVIWLNDSILKKDFPGFFIRKKEKDFFYQLAVI